MNISSQVNSSPANSAPKPVSSPSFEVADDEIDLLALLGALWRGKWLITTFVIIAIAIGANYAFRVAVPMYRSTAVVILDPQQDQVAGLDSVVTGLSGDSSEINSELEVLRARGLMGKVVDKLDLTNDHEFNGSLRPTSWQSQAIDQLRASLGAGAKVEETTDLGMQREAVISELLKKVSVSNIRNSYVFNVTVETENPAKSKLIADTIVELYILNQIEVKFEATEQATSWLSARVAELQVELEQAEAAVAEFSATTELVSIEGLQALERQIKERRDRIDAARADLLVAEARLESLTQAEGVEAQAEVAGDSTVTRLAHNGADQAAFDRAFERVVTRTQVDVTRKEQQLAALVEGEEVLAEKLDLQSKDLIKLQQLSREAEATKLLYGHFLTRLKETSAQQGIQQADSRILSQAVAPNAPASPRKARILALSAVLGFMLGCGIVLFREMRNNSFRAAKDLEQHTGLTVMGQLPTMPIKSRKKVLDYLTEKPTSAAAEAVRNLRTSVLLSNVDQVPQVILSTSSVPGEGKTTNALALAHNLLGLGKSVLLLEGDIRRRMLNQYFDNIPAKGLVSVLSDDLPLSEAVFRPNNFGGDVLAGEASSVNAADLFSSQKFHEFMQKARETYDVIIIDTPPVLVVPDARIIAQEADAVLFTVKWDHTSASQVDEALRIFHNSNQRITGLILGQISPKGMKRYGYGGKYGAYGSYGSKYYTS